MPEVIFIARVLFTKNKQLLAILKMKLAKKHAKYVRTPTIVWISNKEVLGLSNKKFERNQSVEKKNSYLGQKRKS